MRKQIFRKSLAFFLSLAMIISAMSCLLLVPVSAAQDYSKLTATYDFEDGSAADFVQVGGKTGDETATGYESWNYDPEVANVTGLEKHTINFAEIDYANDATVEAVTRKALLAKPYLYQAEGLTYVKSNTATSATACTPYHLGNTSMYVLKDTVDENGVALDTVSKKKISGKFSMDFYETAGKNAWTSIEASPIIIYYYKDANNWRGVRFNSYTITEAPHFGKLTYQNIVCETKEVGGEPVVYYYQETTGRAIASAGYTDTFSDGKIYKDHVLDPSSIPESPTYYNTIGNNAANVNFIAYPTTKGSYYASSVTEDKRFGEWLNFEIDYSLKGAVTITLTDATGLPFQVFISQRTITATANAYDANGNSAALSTDIDYSTGTFAIGATFSMGNNTKKGSEFATAQPTGIGFDDIKVEMSDSGETAVTSVVSAIDAIADKDSYNTAKTAFAALSDSQKLRVTNATDLNKWEKYFAAKRITYDFSEDWHNDALDATWPFATNADSGKWEGATIMSRQRIVGQEGSKKLRISFGKEDYAGKKTVYTSLPSNLLSQVESIAISFKVYNTTGYYSTNTPDVVAYLDANHQLTGRTTVSKFMKDTTAGYRYFGAVGWAGTKALDMPIDWNSTMEMILTPNGTKTNISFKGTEMIDPDDDGVYEVGVNTSYETSSYAVSYGVDKIGLNFPCSAIEIDSIDVKFTGWEAMVGMSPEEEALAARIIAIPEITIDNYATVNAEVSAIREEVDALATTGLAEKAPDGSELTYIEILVAAEAKIAVFTGDVATAQAFANTNNAVINIATANVTESNAQAIIDAHTAYGTLTDAVKSILANNYALLDNAATGTKFTFDIAAHLDEIYAIAIPLAPTQAQIAFLEHYEANGIGALTAAEGKLAILEESIVLYKAVEETHKPNVQAKYDYIIDLLDKHFVDGNEFKYNQADIAGLENITAYFNNTIFNESTTAIDEDRTSNNKTISADKFDATSATSIKLAQDYAVPNAAGTSFITNIGFDFFPKVANLGDISGTGATRYKSNEYFYQSGVALNKQTMYVGGVNQASSTAKKGLNQIYYVNQFQNSSNGTLRQHFANRAASGPFSSGEFNTSFQTEASRFVHFYGDLYMLPGDRIVYDIDYTINYSPALVAGNGQTYKSVTVNFTKFDIWVENSANDNVEGYTAYTYDAPVDGGIEGDMKLGQITKSTTVDMGYTYGEDELVLPQLYLDDHSLQYTQLIEITRQETFAEKYEDALDKTFTEADAAEVIEIAKVYQTLTDSEKAISAEASAKVEAAITSAGLRPASIGSTLSVGANTSIGFRAGKPAVDNYDKFGIVVATYNKMVAKSDKLLTLEDTNVKDYAKAYAMEYAEGDTRSDELIFNVYGLFNEEDPENGKWGVWLVARYYTVYTAEDGTEVAIYSTNDFGNTPAGATEVDTNGQLIRSVNGIISAMANTLYGAKETYKNEVGVDYVNGQGEIMTDYTGKTLAEAYGEETDGLLSTAESTLYLMKAFKGVFTKILAANS